LPRFAPHVASRAAKIREERAPLSRALGRTSERASARATNRAKERGLSGFAALIHVAVFQHSVNFQKTARIAAGLAAHASTWPSFLMEGD